jgi:hypothetical protein
MVVGNLKTLSPSAPHNWNIDVDLALRHAERPPPCPTWARCGAGLPREHEVAGRG